jgi:uncharacterized membrane protein
MGVCASGYFMYLQLNYIRALCIYCMLSAVLTVLLFITALRQLAAARQPASSFAGLARPSGL